MRGTGVEQGKQVMSEKGAINAEHTKEFLGNLEPGDGAGGTDNHVSSAGLPSIAGGSASTDITVDTRDDERRAYQAAGGFYPDDAELGDRGRADSF